MTEARTFSVARQLPSFHRKWFHVCFLGIAGFLGVHAVYGLPVFAIPVAVTTLVGFGLFVEGVFFFALAFIVTFFVALVVPVLGLLGALVPRARRWFGDWIDDGAGRRWSFRPWLHSLAWTILFCGHMGLEVEPHLTVVCLSGVLLLLPEFWRMIEAIWPPLAQRYASWLSLTMAGLWWVLSDDGAMAIAVVIWSALLFVLVRPLGRVLALRDRFALSFFCIPVVQILAAFLPLLVSPEGSQTLANDMAYSFCEVEGTDRLFAAIPRCNPGETACKDGTVDEFDARTLELRAQHHLFSDRYHGRLEGLFCTTDRVQVGMDWTFVDGLELEQNLVEFPLDDPSDFTTNVLGGASGDGIAYDRRRHAFFYRSDLEYPFRRDMETGEIKRDAASASGISAVAAIDFHERRDSLFVLSYYGRVVELDPETFEQKSIYPVLNAWDFVVDEEMDRLYVGGNWGLEVIDLRSAKVIRRARLGLGARRPAIDRKNGLIYVPSTAGGRLQVFDRRSLELLGSIPVGIGMRYPYVSEAHGYVYASSTSASYRWRASDLARRMRGD